MNFNINYKHSKWTHRVIFEFGIVFVIYKKFKIIKGKY